MITKPLPLLRQCIKSTICNPPPLPSCPLLAPFLPPSGARARARAKTRQQASLWTLCPCKASALNRRLVREEAKRSKANHRFQPKGWSIRAKSPICIPKVMIQKALLREQIFDLYLKSPIYKYKSEIMQIKASVAWLWTEGTKDLQSKAENLGIFGTCKSSYKSTCNCK